MRPLKSNLLNSYKRFKRITEELTDYQYTVQMQDGKPVETRQGIACGTVTGYSAKEFAGNPHLWMQMVVPEDRKLVLDRVQQILLGNEIGPVEHRIIRKDGETRWVRDTIILNKDAAGNLLSYDGVIKDITERKRAGEALKAASVYSRNLIETSLDPLVTISAEGKITDVNTATEKITGMSRERLIGSDFADYFTEPDKARAGYLKAFEQGQVRDYPLAIRHPSGKVTEVLYNASVYRNEQGEALGVFAAARDIMALKQAEAEKEKLEAQNRQLQKSESLGRMAGAIAHHFNNQLQVVMMNLDFAMRGLSQGEIPTENLTGAMESARKAAEVSTLMLTYLGQTNAKHEPLDLSETCLRSLPMLQATIPKGFVLDTDFPSLSPIINGNADQIQQVLTNLVTNAWEASLDGRRNIRLTVKVVSVVDIPATNRFPVDFHPEENTYACLEVADEGCGISAREIETIFEPFYSSKFTGRGLGLPVVLGIVRAHTGAITVENEPGRGSVFRVFLPASSEAISHKRIPKKQVPVSPTPKTTQSGTVLVIDDEASLRNVVATAIKGMGFKVLTAQDGVQAVEVFGQHRDEIMLVICDLTMPRMDGWETLTALRKLAPGIPVVLASGYSEAQVMAGHHSELPQAFLSKPYEYEALSDAISRILSKRTA